MIITRSPLRITLGGGGTDLPGWSRQHGGFCVAAAISKYVYVTLHETFDDDLIVKYSEMEHVDCASALKHPIIRECFGLLGMDGKGLEIVSHADIPAGTGLGSSSAFTLALLAALHTFRREKLVATELAREAVVVELERVGSPIGVQDQHISALGGIQALTICPDDTVAARGLNLTPETIHHLEDHLLMFFTGYRRDANDVLRDAVIPGAELLKCGQEMAGVLEHAEWAFVERCLDLQWALKQRYAPSNNAIVWARDVGFVKAEAYGKLIGAGKGGFLLFYVREPQRLREAIKPSGFPEVRFTFDWKGTDVVLS